MNRNKSFLSTLAAFNKFLLIRFLANLWKEDIILSRLMRTETFFQIVLSEGINEKFRIENIVLIEEKEKNSSNLVVWNSAGMAYKTKVKCFLKRL